jgi:hypothetical protein
MSEHKLSPGVKFIEGLENIGDVLGYHVELERPVNSEDVDGPKIDVAWFKGHGQKFPLFIFEVESTASNSMAYNPMKVLSKSNEVFEKPLFFFQIVLNQGQNSSRIEDLKNSYGTYNYRIYRISVDEGSKLIFDILAQHRRLTAELNIVSLVDYLILSGWINTNINDLLQHILDLGFEQESGNFLPALGLLAVRFPYFASYFCVFLDKIYGAQIDYELYPNYSSYVGTHYCVPIHLGIRSIYSKEIFEKAYCLDRLKIWQDNGGHLTKIGAHFGLSMDYDDMLAHFSGAFFALIATLFRDIEAARIYFCQELEKIIDALAVDYRSLNYIWLLHIAPDTPAGVVFKNKATEHFRTNNHFSKRWFNRPPFWGDDGTIYEIVNTHDPLIVTRDLEVTEQNVDDVYLVRAAILSLISNNDKEHDEISRIIVDALNQRL